MAKIRRIRPYSLKDGTTGEDVYPITITDAVIYSSTGTSLTQYIKTVDDRFNALPKRELLTKQQLEEKQISGLEEGTYYLVFEPED